jgi:hypothetical protein
MAPGRVNVRAMPKRRRATAPYRAMRAVLIEERKRAGLRQVDVVKRLGRPQPWIGHIESGRKRRAASSRRTFHFLRTSLRRLAFTRRRYGATALRVAAFFNCPRTRQGG